MTGTRPTRTRPPAPAEAAAYRMWIEQGMSQEEAARRIAEEIGIPVKQYMVSRWAHRHATRIGKPIAPRGKQAAIAMIAAGRPDRIPDPTPRDPDDLLTAADLAARLTVKPSTILNWHRQGRIPAHRLSHNVLRFNRAEVVAALEQSQAATPADR